MVLGSGRVQGRITAVASTGGAILLFAKEWETGVAVRARPSSGLWEWETYGPKMASEIIALRGSDCAIHICGCDTQGAVRYRCLRQGDENDPVEVAQSSFRTLTLRL